MSSDSCFVKRVTSLMSDYVAAHQARTTDVAILASDSMELEWQSILEL